MFLHSLLRQFSADLSLGSLRDIEITGVCEDSRQVQPGNLFIARPGTKSDGARFLSDAAARGAVAAIVQAKSSPSPLPQIVVENPAVGRLEAGQSFSRRPFSKVRVLGVTGTNGKTTTAYLIRHILSSIKNALRDDRHRRDRRRPHRAAKPSMTTPGATEIARAAGGDARQRLPGLCDGSIEPCAGPGPRRRRHFAGAGVHQSHRRSSRLSQDDGRLRRRQGAALRDRSPQTAVAVVNDDDKWSAPHGRKTARAGSSASASARSADYRARDVAITANGSQLHPAHPRRPGRSANAADRQAQHRKRPGGRGAGRRSLRAFGSSDRRRA